MKFDLSKSAGTSSQTDSSKDTGSKTFSNTGKKKPKFIILGIGCLVVLGLGVWYLVNNNSSPSLDIATKTTEVNTAVDNKSSQLNQTSDKHAITSNESKSKTDTANENTSSNSLASQKNSSVPENNSGGSDTEGNQSSSALTHSSPNTLSGKTNESNLTSSSFNNKILAGFNAGSSILNSIAESEVSDIVSYLNRNTSFKATVNGYASSEGDLSFNKWLSQKRANVFKDFLVKKGIATDRINALGKGIDDPVAPNNTEEGRIKNRRVEIILSN